jgi:hypothetical protein
MKSTLVSPYFKPEKNCGDRLKVILLQTYDMQDRHNLQIYEILSVFMSLVRQAEFKIQEVARKPAKRAPAKNSSCGDDSKTNTKYRGAEKTLGNSLSCCDYQIQDMFLIDGLNFETIFNLVKDLVDAHIFEEDELENESTES